VDRTETRLADKTGWPPGPWHDEPDQIRWDAEGSGLPCLVTRHPRRGHLCGYAGVPRGHLLHGRDAGSVRVAVHWELSYAGPSPEQSPGPGESADTWWFGFHCCHADDLCPADPVAFLEGAEYRTVEYVGVVCEILAAQFAAAQARRDEILRAAAFVCPRCGTPSHNPNDAAAGYCGRCHDWTGRMLTPVCPLCGGAPAGSLPCNAEQAFCANRECTLTKWVPGKSLDENLLDAGAFYLDI
jgi:ribosomal protein S27AE